MGDRQDWTQPGGGIMLNGILPTEEDTVTPFLDLEAWSAAEERTAQLIARIQPNNPSEERRNAVANYVQRLIMQRFPCQVFTFGSVPLKTYLPDGDIDLTAFSPNTDMKDWVEEVAKVLKNEEKSETAEFHVKEVKHIPAAEVQIVKCLVENIVVDISFNQLGGLCTLCFLEEVDHFINHEHIFKRSIILIKAWCYYESRILGAHHGLISTYALETLVLYIFHVFNNSFSGPLEVLFRFLEFFSKFDWENFCVSLWGPVPISSLPDMTAECPRKDGGELLFNKGFLNGCSQVYAVSPTSQENQGQSFVAKHFNVVDPLRINNNLGRSVSRGNFYRIRSAFAFGAKKLAELLSCSKENIMAEVDKFFINTWNRHGTGKRHDAPRCTVSVADVEMLQTSAMTKQLAETYGLLANHRNPGDVLSSLNDFSSTPVISAKRTTESLVRNVDNISESQTSPGSQATSALVNRIQGNIAVNEFMHPEVLPKDLRPGHFYPIGQGGFQSARTHSSPELTDPSCRILGHSTQNRAGETENNQFICTRQDESTHIDNYGTEISRFQNERSSKGSLSPRYSSAHSSTVVVPNTNNNLKSCHDDGVFLNAEDITSISQSLEMPEEGQNLVNVVASSMIHSINGQLQQTVPGSSHLPIQSMVLPSGCSQGKSGIIQDAIEQGRWPELDVALSRGFSLDNRKFEGLSADERNVPSTGVNFPSSREDNSTICNLRGQSRSARGTGRPLKTDHPDISVLQNTRESGSSSYRPENFRPTNTLMSDFQKELVSESWDGSIMKGSKTPREKRGRKAPSSSVVTSSHARKNEWLSDSSSLDGLPSSTDDHGEELFHEPHMYELAEQSINTCSQIPLSPHVAGLDSTFVSGSDPVFSVGPMRICGGPRHALYDFFPTGPPVPIFMVPVKIPPDSAICDGSLEQFNEMDSSHSTPSIRNLNLSERAEEPDLLLPSTSVNDSSEKFDECKGDILYSDFSSHWQNLQYGRLCQDSNIPGPPVYPSPLVIPPMYLQGRFQWDGPGRPVPTIPPINYGPRLVPILPVQSNSNRPDAYQRYGDEMPRFRSGTGTYLPKTKVHFRERQSSVPRNSRGNYNYDRCNNGEREGNWVNPKSRISYNNQGRHQSDRPNTRIDRSLPADNQLDRSWDTKEPGRIPSNRHNSAFNSSSSNNISSNMAYMCPLTPVGSSNINAGGSVPSLMMLYQYDLGIGYSSPELVEFGSLGPVHLRELNEMQQSSGANALRGSSELRGDNYQQGSASSSPDQPSSPQFHRQWI